MKKLICTILAICIMFTIVPLEAIAAPKSLGTINSFNENLSYDQYNALRKGDYKAVQKSGTWYYQFTTDKHTLLVKASAFASPVKNDYTRLNEKLTKGVANTTASTTPSYVYKEQSVRKIMPLGNSHYSRPLGNEHMPFNEYSTYISYMKFMSSLSGNKITLQAEKNGHVLFKYSAKVRGNSRMLTGTNYRTPSNAIEYKEALERNISNSVGNTITPTFTVSVDKTGSNKILLKEFFYKNKGVVKEKNKVDRLIDIAVTTGKLTVEMAAKDAGIVDSLYDILKQGISLDEKGGTYSETKSYPLSKNYKNKDYKVLRGSFRSPVDLKKHEDYFEVNLNLNKTPASGTKISVKFSAK